LLLLLGTRSLTEIARSRCPFVRFAQRYTNITLRVYPLIMINKGHTQEQVGRCRFSLKASELLCELFGLVQLGSVFTLRFGAFGPECGLRVPPCKAPQLLFGIVNT